MKREHREIIYTLKKLEEIWPEDLILFADNGSLAVVDANTGEQLADFIGVLCDGGDPGQVLVGDKVYYEEYMRAV